MTDKINLYQLIQKSFDSNLITPEQKEKLIKEYGELSDDQLKLSALECAGVDNWCGYSVAMELLQEWNEEKNNSYE